MEKTKDHLDHLTQHFMVAAILIAAALTLLGMVLQFISPQAQALVTQLSYYAYGWAVFLSLGPTIKRRVFLRIDLVACRYPKPLQAALKLAGDGILLLLMALLCVLSIRDLLSSISSGAVSPSAPVIPLALAYAAPVVGYALGMAASIRNILTGKTEGGGT